MSDDTTRPPAPRDPGSSAPEEGELQLRKALSTMNDLEPPRDDLFAQRALTRGRARTSRRRSTVLGAAAALVVVGAVGGTWVASNQGATSSTASAGAASEVMKDATGDAGADNGAQGLRGSQTPSGSGVAPSVPSARDATRWFGTLSTPQTNAFDAIEPTVAARWPGVFSGAYAADPAGARVAVGVTRRDADLEAFVKAAMPSPSDVDFVVMRHSLVDKERVAQEIGDQRALWAAKGIQILGVTQDGRIDRVVVTADEGSSPGLVERQYGDIVRVVTSTQTAPGKLPDGSTLPTLQR